MGVELTTVLQRIARSVLSFASADRQVTEIGAFSAIIDPHSDIPWLSGAIPCLPAMEDPAIVAESLCRLSTHFRAAQRKLRFEYFEDLHPRLEGMLEEAGFKRTTRQPILTCGPGGIDLVWKPGIEIRNVRASDPESLLEAFIEIRDRSFGDATTGPQAAAALRALRDAIASGLVISCIAYLDGKAAGAGSLQSAGGVGELVGIATLPEQRRRGVASAVSAELAGRHFTSGGELAWLTAGDAAAEAVYRGIGFRATGAHQLCFEGVPT